jgi:hypothetical protein
MPKKPQRVGLSDEANDFAQLLLEAVQDLGLMQRVADYARGRERDADIGWFEQELAKFTKEIY